MSFENEPIEVRLVNDNSNVSVPDAEIEVKLPPATASWGSEIVSFLKSKIASAPKADNSSSALIRRAGYFSKLDNIISSVLRSDIDSIISNEDLKKIDGIRASIDDEIRNCTAMGSAYDSGGYCKHHWLDCTESLDQVFDVGSLNKDVCKRLTCKNCGRIKDVKFGDPNENVDFPKAPKTASLSKTAATPNIVPVADPFFHNIARDIINYCVSSGYATEDGVKKAVTDFSLNKREEYVLRSHLNDIGHTVARMVWLPPAQVTYAKDGSRVVEGASDSRGRNIGQGLESDIDRFSFLNFKSQFEEALAAEGIDISDVYNRGVYSDTELRNDWEHKVNLDEVVRFVVSEYELGIDSPEADPAGDMLTEEESLNDGRSFPVEDEAPWGPHRDIKLDPKRTPRTRIYSDNNNRMLVAEDDSVRDVDDVYENVAGIMEESYSQFMPDVLSALGTSENELKLRIGRSNKTPSKIAEDLANELDFVIRASGGDSVKKNLGVMVTDPDMEKDLREYVTQALYYVLQFYSIVSGGLSTTPDEIFKIFTPDDFRKCWMADKPVKQLGMEIADFILEKDETNVDLILDNSSKWPQMSRHTDASLGGK